MDVALPGGTYTKFVVQCSIKITLLPFFARKSFFDLKIPTVSCGLRVRFLITTIFPELR